MKAQRSGGARDRLLAIGSTGTFYSSSGPIAEMRGTSPILGAVFKWPRMRNRKVALPDVSASRASKQSGISLPHSAEERAPRFGHDYKT